MRSSSLSENQLRSALNADWVAPGTGLEKTLSCSNQLSDPALVTLFLDGAYRNDLISCDRALIPQLLRLAEPTCRDGYASEALFFPSRILNRIYLADLLYEQLSRHSDLSPELILLLNKLRPAVVRAILTSDAFFDDDKHPLRIAMKDICIWGIPWEPQLGRGADQYFKAMQQLADQVLALPAGSRTLPEAYTTTLQTLNAFTQRYQQVEERLCESEQALMETAKVRRQTENLINKWIAGRKLPEPAIRFFHGVWVDVINRVLIMGDEDKKGLESIARLTEKILFSLSPIDTSEKKQKIYQLTPSIFPELKKMLSESGVASGKEHLVDELNRLLMGIVRGESYAMEPAPLLSSLQIKGVRAEISSTIAEQVQRLQQGQWILFQTDTKHSVRAKLSLFSGEAGQLLFVNLLGKKLFTKSVEEVGFALNTKQARLLCTTKLFNNMLAESIKLFTKQYRDATENPVATARTRALHENKIKSAQKALAEAEQLNVKRANEKPVPVQLNREGERLTDKDRGYIETLVKSLRIGAWVSMKNRFGEQMPCKIAIIYATSGKLVIVDKMGMRVGEFMPEELVTLIMEGSASILEAGDSFESSLSRVIETLRK
jgi:hypothetical protein